jgi:hypothetical protein
MANLRDRYKVDYFHRFFPPPPIKRATPRATPPASSAFGTFHVPIAVVPPSHAATWSAMLADEGAAVTVLVAGLCVTPGELAAGEGLAVPPPLET